MRPQSTWPRPLARQERLKKSSDRRPVQALGRSRKPTKASVACTAPCRQPGTTAPEVRPPPPRFNKTPPASICPDRPDCRAMALRASAASAGRVLRKCNADENEAVNDAVDAVEVTRIDRRASASFAPAHPGIQTRATTACQALRKSSGGRACQVMDSSVTGCASDSSTACRA